MKKVNWKQIIEDLLEGLYLSQQELSERCEVSQQSISNWARGARNPTNSAKKRIVEILGEEKKDLTDYQLDENEIFLMKHIHRKDIRELLEAYDSLPAAHRREMMELTRAKKKQHEKGSSMSPPSEACLKCQHQRGKQDEEHSHQDLAHGDIPPAPVQQ